MDCDDLRSLLGKELRMSLRMYVKGNRCIFTHLGDMFTTVPNFCLKLVCRLFTIRNLVKLLNLSKPLVGDLVS